jgi:hypothetical protein
VDVLSVIVPIRNDERGIRSTCLDIAHIVRPLIWDGTIEDYEIVLVDDASTDGTGASADVFAERDRNVVVVHHTEEQGYDAAVRSGLAVARGSIVAHGHARASLATAALRPAIEKLAADGLRSVVLRPGIRLSPTRHRTALTLLRNGPGAGGEENLPRAAGRLRPERAPSRMPDRTRIGIAPLAALSLVVTLIAFAVLSGGKQRLPAASGDLVGRHGHLPLVHTDVKTSTSPSASATIADVPIGRAVVTPAVPAPVSVKNTPLTAPAIDDTCSTDVTSALQDRVNGAPDGSTIALEPKGCYLVAKGLSFVRRDGVTIDGRGAELRSGTITCVDSSRVELANVILTPKQQGPAIQLADCASVAIANVGVNGADEALAITGASHDISVSVLRAVTEHAAVEVTGGQSIAFDHVALESTKAAAVQLDPSSGSTIKNLEIRASSLTSELADIGSIGHGTIENVYIHGNELLGGHTKVFVRNDSSNPYAKWRIYANRGDLTRTLSSYVDFSDVQDVLVANNVLQATVVPLRAAVRFSTATGYLAVLNNDFTGACHAYTADGSSSHVKASGNHVSNC